MGSVFIGMADYFKMYKIYCGAHRQGIALVDELNKSNPKFKELLDVRLYSLILSYLSLDAHADIVLNYSNGVEIEMPRRPKLPRSGATKSIDQASYSCVQISVPSQGSLSLSLSLSPALRRMLAILTICIPPLLGAFDQHST